MKVFFDGSSVLKELGIIGLLERFVCICGGGYRKSFDRLIIQ